MHISNWTPETQEKEAERTASRRRRGPRLGEAAGGILLLAVILAVVCTCLLLLDHLGVPPAAMSDFPLIG